MCTREKGELVETSCTIMDLKNVGVGQFWKVSVDSMEYEPSAERECALSWTMYKPDLLMPYQSFRSPATCSKRVTLGSIIILRQWVSQRSC